jgi:hypothetical protein
MGDLTMKQRLCTMILALLLILPPHLPAESQEDGPPPVLTGEEIEILAMLELLELLDLLQELEVLTIMEDEQ